MTHLVIALVLLVISSGCAAVKQQAGFDIIPEGPSKTVQVWESQALKGMQPSHMQGVTVYSVSLAPNHPWLKEEVYCLENGVLPVETWRTLVFLDNGIFQGTALVNEEKTVILLLFPFEYDERQLEGRHAVIISAFAKSVLTMQAQTVALTQQELARLAGSVVFQEEFFAKYPSVMRPRYVVQILYDTPEGRLLFDSLEKRFPDRARLENGQVFAVRKDEFLRLASISSQEYFFDRFLTSGSLPLGPGMVACPECMIPNLAWGLYKASRDPHQVCLDWIAAQRKK